MASWTTTGAVFSPHCQNHQQSNKYEKKESSKSFKGFLIRDAQLCSIVDDKQLSDSFVLRSDFSSSNLPYWSTKLEPVSPPSSLFSADPHEVQRVPSLQLAPPTETVAEVVGKMEADDSNWLMTPDPSDLFEPLANAISSFSATAAMPYRARRDRNNEASRRSRAGRKARFEAMKTEAVALETRGDDLRTQIADLERIRDEWKGKLLNAVAGRRADK